MRCGKWTMMGLLLALGLLPVGCDKLNLNRLREKDSSAAEVEATGPEKAAKAAADEAARAPLPPLPAKPSTYETVTKAKQAWYERNLTGSYQRDGQHNPAWDGAAVSFLQGCARRDTASQEEAPTWKELCTQGQAVLAAGCDDVRVLTWQGIALANSRQLTDALAMTRRALEQLKTAKAPAIYQFILRTNELKYLTKTDHGQTKDPELNTMRQQMLEALAASLAAGEFGPGEEFIILGWIDDMDSQIFGDDVNGRLATALMKQQPKGDPWFEKIFRAKSEIDQAWEARGNGWASTVKEEGWQGFNYHCEMARKLCNEAWRLHPERPEAAQMMIKMTMAGHGNAGDTEEQWFKRAVAARSCGNEPYRSMLWALRPRWGGSYQAMLDFGERCAATKNYADGVPLWYWVALRDIGSELPPGQRRAIFHMRGAYDKLMVMCEGLLNDPTRTREQANLKALRGVLAMACGHYDQAAKWWPEVSPEVDYSDTYWGYPLTAHGEGRAAVEGELMAFIGPQKDVMEEGLKNELAGQLDEALACYEKALAASAHDALTSAFIAGRCGELRLYQLEPKANDYGDYEPLVMACFFHHDGLAKQMIEHGVELDATGPHGYTPLMFAVANNQPDLVRLLLERGADPNAGDNRGGWTALALAIHNNQVDLTKMLLAKGANPKAVFWNGTPITSLTNETHNAEIIALLKAAGAPL